MRRIDATAEEGNAFNILAMSRDPPAATVSRLRGRPASRPDHRVNVISRMVSRMRSWRAR